MDREVTEHFFRMRNEKERTREERTLRKLEKKRRRGA